MVTVVLPVFNAFRQLAECIESLDRHTATARVLVINDASTDVRIAPLLQNWTRAHPLRELITNPENRGFVHSVNVGMERADGDVILLNSDTVVTPQWLESLTRCLASDRFIGTATPWSNNGEIVSIPEFCKAAPVPEDVDHWASCIASLGKPQYPDIPTAVGFCMAISRDALDQCGPFDEQLFGKGYGEENDFSMKVRKAGLRNVLCDDAFVAHHGGSSFGELGIQPDSASMQRLLSRHPDYESLVHSFIAADPLASRRQRVVAAIEEPQRRTTG